MVGFLKVGRPYTTPLSLKFFYLSFPHACFLDFVFVPLFFSLLNLLFLLPPLPKPPYTTTRASVSPVVPVKSLLI